MYNRVPKLSVIIPVYNVESQIEKCVISLFNQSVKEGVEFIFVDDESTDNSIDFLKRILEKFPDRKHQTKIISHTKNRGLAAARNTGFEHSNGEYILHCDSDDWVAFDLLEKLLNVVDEQNADVIVFDYNKVYKNKEIKYSHDFQNKSLQEIKTDFYTMKFPSFAWNKLIHRSLYAKQEKLWTEGINMWEDVSVIPRLLANARKISLIPQSLYFYNQLNNNSYTKKKSPDSLNQIFQSSEIVISYFIGNNDIFTKKHHNILRNKALYFILLNASKKDRAKWINIYKINDLKYDSSSLNMLGKIRYFLLFKDWPILSEIPSYVSRWYNKLMR